MKKIHISNAIRDVNDQGSELDGGYGTEMLVLNCTKIKVNKISTNNKSDEKN